jgi:ubiquinone/menaquinone biosynthesis C-methylase UbiE
VRTREGWDGWDAYAPFYDWENARTLGRRDVPFWVGVARRAKGRVLELGCGTGRITKPMVEAGVDVIGVDRSEQMLASGRLPAASRGARDDWRPSRYVRGDVRALPFSARTFAAVIAPYGLLQSLLKPRDLTETLESAARVLKPGGTFGLDLVPDVPRWREYKNKVQLEGRHGGAHLTLVESVRQDRKRRLTIFKERYIERAGGRTREHAFELAFRTLTVPRMEAALDRAGFRIDAALGDYRGRPWDARADVWIILAKKR